MPTCVNCYRWGIIFEFPPSCWADTVLAGPCDLVSLNYKFHRDADLNVEKVLGRAVKLTFYYLQINVLYCALKKNKTIRFERINSINFKVYIVDKVNEIRLNDPLLNAESIARTRKNIGQSCCAPTTRIVVRWCRFLLFISL